MQNETLIASVAGSPARRPATRDGSRRDKTLRESLRCKRSHSRLQQVNGRHCSSCDLMVVVFFVNSCSPVNVLRERRKRKRRRLRIAHEIRKPWLEVKSSRDKTSRAEAMEGESEAQVRVRVEKRETFDAFIILRFF